MELKYLCPYWGREGGSIESFIDDVVAAGYDGIEINLPEDSAFIQKVKTLVEENNLICVAQQWLEPRNESVESYIKRLQKTLQFKAEVNPVFINSHTGRDYYSFEDNCKVIDVCIAFEIDSGIPIVHETHRGRFPFSAKETLLYLDKYPELKLNADFSHWAVVSESFLEEQAHSLNKAMQNSHYLHARVGHTQSPQVNNPFTPENADYLNTFVGWWKAILKIAEENGQKQFFICPEFGPEPYMPAVPYTNMPIASQWNINVQMMEYLRSKLQKPTLI